MTLPNPEGISAPRCPACAAALPPNNPQFCIECGTPLTAGAPTIRLASEPVAAVGTPTVRLGNARVPQAVLGGTIRLPTAGAIPPGLWFLEQPPGADDVVAVYAPLRAVVGGWSGLLGGDWQPGEGQPGVEGGRSTFLFEASRTWFPAPDCGGGLLLHITIRAQAEADIGRSRRGFRYRSHYDPPMEVADAWWTDAGGRAWVEAPLPRIQLMAPPRIARVSDYDESIRVLPAAEAMAAAREGRLQDRCHLLSERQERTPAGRGLALGIAGGIPLLRWLFSDQRPAYHVQLTNPLVCGWDEWQALQSTIRAEARGYGLDMDSDAVVEWWLDRKEHDSLVLDGAKQRYSHQRVVIAFRRAQIIRVEEEA
ncbi:MAG TPA: zinc ribbon domain-containing protein [Roseiflexaceae bacterium]|nr:zinc ribbon domain-containing protein [Roseiflexaceae bacterium]